MSRLTAFLVMAALAAAGGAQAAVTVIGGDSANACSRAAVVGQSDLKFEALCNDALQNEFLSPHDRAGTFVNRGVMRLRRLSFEDARRDFDAAVKLQSKMGEAYVNRGAASIGLRRYAESLPDLDRAIELGLEEPEKAYFNRALAHEGVGDLKKAYFDYLKAAELSPQWPAPRDELVRFSVSAAP